MRVLIATRTALFSGERRRLACWRRRPRRRELCSALPQRERQPHPHRHRMASLLSGCEFPVTDGISSLFRKIIGGSFQDSDMRRLSFSRDRELGERITNLPFFYFGFRKKWGVTLYKLRGGVVITVGRHPLQKSGGLFGGHGIAFERDSAGYTSR